MRSITPERIEEAARLAHEVNRGYCAFLGDTSQLPWAEAPDWQRDSALMGARAIARGEIKTPGDSHRSWLAVKEAEGWVWGPVKNPEAKEHPCMVPFEDLPAEQQVKDFLFLATVQAVLWPPAPVDMPHDVVDLIARLDKLYEPHRHKLRSVIIGTDAEGLAAYQAAMPEPLYANSRLSGLGYQNLLFKNTAIVVLFEGIKRGYHIVRLDDDGLPAVGQVTPEGVQG